MSYHAKLQMKTLDMRSTCIRPKRNEMQQRQLVYDSIGD